MSKKVLSFALFALPLISLQAAPAAPPQTKNQTQAFDAFTGKITANKVRLRSGPDLDSKIIKELDKDDLLVVTGEQNGFYAVETPKGMKGYIFRSFVLDNVIEGSKVNVRLEPSLEAPVLTQMQSGEKVEGVISSQNQKWLEIDLPKQTRFYIAKEYVTSIGRKELLETLQKRKAEALQLLTEANVRCQNELQKPFDQIAYDFVQNNYKRIIQNYQDFPEYCAKAEAGLNNFQEIYLKGKIAHLESKNKRLEAEAITLTLDKQEEAPARITRPKSCWDEQEERLYAAWEKAHPGKNRTDFYQEELATAVPLKGVLEPYSNNIRNRPGEFVLKVNNIPVAFLYSTSLDLSSMVGKNVEVIGIRRPNNHFAYPAFLAISEAS